MGDEKSRSPEAAQVIDDLGNFNLFLTGTISWNTTLRLTAAVDLTYVLVPQSGQTPLSIKRSTIRNHLVATFVTGGALVPGDCNLDGGLDISDAICYLSFLFTGTVENLPCGEDGDPEPDGADVTLLDFNSDGGVDISDAISVLGFR